jgi:hypothetical protein
MGKRRNPQIDDDPPLAQRPLGHRPQFAPTQEQRRQVMAMTGFGIIQDEIARILEIDDKTLRKHFRRELDIGATEANVRVASALYTMATKDKNVAAAIWWTKTRMGWKDTTVQQQTGPDGGPVRYVIRGPTAVESADQWLETYAPKTIDHTDVDTGSGE